MGGKEIKEMYILTGCPLTLPSSMSRIHPIFNVVKLLSALKDPILGQKTHPPPSPVLVDGQEHYIVEKILDSHFIWNHLHFLVKWEGYGYEAWVSKKVLSAPSKLQEFYMRHPGAPQRICSTAFDSLNFRASRAQHPRRGGDVRGPPVLLERSKSPE